MNTDRRSLYTNLHAAIVAVIRMQGLELLGGKHQQQTEQEKKKELHDLTVEVRRLRYWAKVIINNHESRIRALSQEPKPCERELKSRE